MIRRREFISVLGGAAAWPITARAQQPALPVIGYLDPRTPDSMADLLRAFRQGLKENGYVDGENTAIVHRWAEYQIDRLPELAADLARRRVALIAASAPPAALSAKAATRTIPVVFIVNEDPVRLGLVASLARPGGNLTGVNIFNAELVAKRLEFLRELVPAATRLAVLVNPANATTAESTLRDIEPAARAMGLRIQVFNARSSQEIEAAFTALVHDRPDALFVAADPLFYGRRVQLANLASRHAIPATYSNRAIPEAGGLMSYGSDVLDAWRQLGSYAGRILKGAQPADLPVVQATKLELVINAGIAKMLGLTVPDKLLATADEVIE